MIWIDNKVLLYHIIIPVIYIILTYLYAYSPTHSYLTVNYKELYYKVQNEVSDIL